ncbi:MAG: riboflavin synthase [Gammaproteobacteria bacterium]
MFTGIVEALGRVTSLQQQQSDWRLTVASDSLDLDEVVLGDSIAVNGCCLTVIAKSGDEFSADVSNETLRCTTLGELAAGANVNLEKAMLASSRFGGHMVSGHVDGIGEVGRIETDGDSLVVDVVVPEAIARYIAAKGSIAIDGTSLTVNKVAKNTFSVNIIPHTRDNTIIGGYKVGSKVNLEVDLVARYLERLLQFESVPQKQS